MGYYSAARGGYALKARVRQSYYRSRGGFFSSIGRALGSVASVAGRILPGPIGTIASVAGRVLGGSPPTLAMPGGLPMTTLAGGQRPEPGVRGAVHRMVPGGESGYLPRKRMNAGNAKAARRAIRRIKSVRKLLQSIERELPRRPAKRGSFGVITRAEAARALRS